MSIDIFMAGVKKRDKQRITYCNTKDMKSAPVRLKAIIKNMCICKKLKESHWDD